MIIFFLAYFFVCISDSYSAVLPLNDTVADRQNRVVQALNHPPYNPPNNHNFLEHINRHHRPETIERLAAGSISDVIFDRRRIRGNSYFLTSDRGIIKDFIERAINFAQQNPIPAHTTLTRFTRRGIARDDHIEVICDLHAAGVLSPYFTVNVPAIGVVNMPAIGVDIRNANNAVRGYTSRIVIYLKINNYDGLWRFSTAFPIT